MFFADELHESERRMKELAHVPVKKRVQLALLYLASYVGAAYETVFKMLNELSDLAAISMSGKEIRLLEENKLLSENYFTNPGTSFMLQSFFYLEKMKNLRE
jgi:CRP/FNR family transcriptional regulator